MSVQIKMFHLTILSHFRKQARKRTLVPAGGVIGLGQTRECGGQIRNSEFVNGIKPEIRNSKSEILKSR